MKRVFGCRLLPLLLGVFALALCASADTLELKDRRVINGKYMGGTQDNVRFLVNGKVELYPVEQIVALTFGAEEEPEAKPEQKSGEKPREKRTEESSGSALAGVTSSGRPAGPGQTVTVPAGTRILVRMIDGVDSAKNKLGDKFQASLEEGLTVGDTVVAPKGADVYGRLAEAQEAGHVGGKSQLKLELTEIIINGRPQPIVSGDYEVSGKSRGKQSAERIGGGAALGAVIGAIAGGGKGAAIGAGVGAGAGTAVQVLTRGEQVRVPSETMLEFRIDQPFTVDVSKPGVR